MLNDSPLKTTNGKQIKVEDVDLEKQKKLQNHKGSIIKSFSF